MSRQLAFRPVAGRVAPRLFPALLLFASAAGAAGATSADFKAVERAYVQYAADFPFLATNELLYERDEPYLAAGPAVGRYKALLKELTGRADATEDLAALLKHEEPRVRALAIAALYWKGDPHVLDRIYELTDDKAQTFPDPPPDVARLATSGIGPPQEPKTVGATASAVIRFYLERAPTRDDFKAYWPKHKGRSSCAGWFAVDLDRAIQGTSPTPPGRVDKVRLVRQRIDRIPEPDRTWTLLVLSVAHGGPDLVTEQELVAAAKAVGPEKLMRVVRGEKFSDDPDLTPTSGWPIPRFLDRHAKELLRPEDADAMRASGHVVAAAQLMPAQASKWLHAEYDRLKNDEFGADKRATLAAVLWRTVGLPEADFLVNWFYTESVQRGRFPPERAQFLEEVIHDNTQDTRRLVARIVNDPRLDQLGPYSTRVLVQLVGTWTGEALVGEAELRESSSHQELDREFAPLAEWHRKLRASLRQWAPDRP